jgi:inositol-pentakisphosphate 2-kinase
VSSEWQYRGEGGANIVYAYIGSHFEWKCRVMRIEKIGMPLAQQLRDWETNPESLRAFAARRSPVLAAADAYEQQVIRPLIGGDVFCAVQLVQLPSSFIHNLALQTENCRPEHRRLKSSPCVACTMARLMDDACLLGCDGPVEPTLCVELKPKCGFLPEAHWLSRDVDLKTKFSRYHMLQRLKIKRGEASHISHYDPLDLFSNDETRVQQALGHMMICPQNNFRLFLNGEFVADHFAAQELLGVPLVQTLTSILLHSNVLSRILAVQKLDMVDVENIHTLYQQLRAQDRPTEDYAVPLDFVRPVRKVLSRDDLSALSDDEKLALIHSFLVAHTAMDLSLMVAFTSKDDFRIRLVDLEPKGAERISRYHALDVELCALMRSECPSSALV